jgi:SOS response regulatory protein OraA/RecX
MDLRIEALDPVEGKNTVRVRIGEQTLEIASDAARALELAVGRPLTAALGAAIEAAADRRSAAARVLRHLHGRPRTASEVRTYLARHGHTPATVAAVVADLEQRGLVDDVRYAQWFVDGRLAHRPMGRRRLVRELCARGVERDIAENAADRAAGGRETELAFAAARPRLAQAKRLGRERGMRRMAAYLSRRGFADGVVREVCLQLFAGVPQAPNDPEEP